MLSFGDIPEYTGGVNGILKNMEKGIRVLIVDDEAVGRELYAEYFRSVGFDVHEANDGLEALEKVAIVAPDVILTGIIMPRMDGFTLFDALKKNVVSANIPVIFFSHLGREEDRRHAFDMGAKDFIVRDMTPPAEVAKLIRELFGAMEFTVAIDPNVLDAQKLAESFDISPDFLCDKEAGSRIAIKLRTKDRKTRRFDAEIICV